MSLSCVLENYSLWFYRLFKRVQQLLTIASQLVLISLAALAFNVSAYAASAETQALQNTDQQTAVNELKKLLADPKVQAWLQESIDQPNAENAQHTQLKEGLRDNFSIIINKIRVRKTDLFTAWDQVNQAPKMIVRKWQQEMSNAQTLRSVTYILIFLFVGAGLEWLYGQYAGQHLLKLELQKPQSLKRRIHTAFFRALLTFAGLCCFALGSIGVFLSFNWTPLVENLVMEILIVIITVRIGITVTRFFLAPRLKELRLVPLSNVQAKSVYFWSSILIFLCALNIAVANVFEKLLDGLQNQVLSHSTLSINLISNFVLLVVALFSLYRGYQVFRASESPSETMANKPLVYQFWTGYLSVLLIVSYILWMLDISLIMQTLFILGLLVPLMRLFRTWIDYLFDQAEYKKVTEDKLSVGAQASDQTSEEIEDSAAEEINQHPYDNYRPIARRLLRFALVVIAFLALMMVWGYNPFSLSNVDSFSGKLFGISLDVVAVVMIGDLVWIWAKTVIDKRLTDYRPPEDGHAPGPEARMATLLPLLRTMLIVTLFSVVVFSVLASLGFNIGPLLAGAGVIGLAIGFGAQTLVKDVVSGIFYLIDDAFRVGEYIEIGNLRGTVESMSIRSLRIRHHRGAVHTVPFGELNSITNHSRDWVIMKLEFRVPFDTDMKQVKKLVKKIGKKLLENADFGHSFIEPLKSQGVRRMEEFNMVLGVKFMTRPGEQWVIRREAYHQIRDTFEANGINLAERNVKVQVLNADKLDEETKQAAIGAAQHATEQPLPAGPIPDEP